MLNKIAAAHSDKETTIIIKGRFIFDLHPQFRAAYLVGSDQDNRRYTIDMGGVEYIDSSAIGMLLMMREETAATNENITIVKASPTVLKALKMVGFDQLFTIL
ncbi:MAG: STAS domain-containing protein [Magnetococcus sp. DMHC-8]